MFPLLPAFDFITILAYPYELILLFLFICLLATWIVTKKAQLGILALGTIFFILLQDQMRWQPWVYFYLIMLFPYLFQNNKEENAKFLLMCLQCIIVGVYVWSGIHKFNPNFIEGTFVSMLKLIGIHTTSKRWLNLGYTIPLTEVTIGLALLILKWRNMAVCAAVLMHVLILIYLSPFALNYNLIVYPWNLAMIMFLVTIFWNNSLSMRVFFFHLHLRFVAFFIFLIIGVLPILNFRGYWDHYLSFSLYSNKHSYFYIAIEQSEINKINTKLKDYFVQWEERKGEYLIDVHKWSTIELGVPFYPEKRCFKILSKTFCAMHIDNEKLLFIEKRPNKGKWSDSVCSCERLASF